MPYWKGCLKKDALNRFNELINNSEQYKINLQPNTCMIINNTLALHCRDVIQDNRRLLIRIFGYKNNIEYISLEDDSVLAQG
ncbi:TauD/TfdA family dioxygenase [Neisseria sp.]